MWWIDFLHHWNGSYLPHMSQNTLTSRQFPNDKVVAYTSILQNGVKNRFVDAFKALEFYFQDKKVKIQVIRLGSKLWSWKFSKLFVPVKVFSNLYHYDKNRFRILTNFQSDFSIEMLLIFKFQFIYFIRRRKILKVF